MLGRGSLPPPPLPVYVVQKGLPILGLIERGEIQWNWLIGTLILKGGFLYNWDFNTCKRMLNTEGVCLIDRGPLTRSSTVLSSSSLLNSRVSQSYLRPGDKFAPSFDAWEVQVNNPGKIVWVIYLLIIWKQALRPFHFFFASIGLFYWCYISRTKATHWFHKFIHRRIPLITKGGHGHWYIRTVWY